MEATQTEIEAVMARLAATPRRIAAASDGLTEAQLQFKPEPKAWSANEIVAHLRVCVDVWGDTIEAMLTEDRPTLRYLSPRTRMRKTNYSQLPFSESFQTFVEQRNALLKTLADLDFADWSRAAMIKEREHTIFTQARRMSLHEETHCEQIETMLK